jgi:hypothetical protein
MLAGVFLALFSASDDPAVRLRVPDRYRDRVNTEGDLRLCYPAADGRVLMLAAAFAPPLLLLGAL